MQVFIRLITNKLFNKAVVLVLTIFVYIVITRQAFLVIKMLIFLFIFAVQDLALRPHNNNKKIL